MDRLFWNGSDWRRVEKVANYDPELTYMMKVGYINGVLDGRLFYYLKAWTMEHTFADSLYAETVDYLSPRELVKVLDNFYADPINGYIPLPSAIIICNITIEKPIMPDGFEKIVIKTSPNLLNFEVCFSSK